MASRRPFFFLVLESATASAERVRSEMHLPKIFSGFVGGLHYFTSRSCASSSVTRYRHLTMLIPRATLTLFRV